jgi:putative methyltransferase (TIGR04325 family)
MRLVTAYQQRFLRVRWEGDFATWADARNAGTGYDRPEILHQIEQSTQRVVTGQAGFERDGVAFPHAPEPWSALPLLREAAAASGGRLHVLDFGGSLGSTYHPHREVLSALGDLRWSIVEQPDFVAAGKRAFETEVLRFHETITDAVTAAGRPPEVVLLGSSLSYVPDPLQVLKELVTLRPRLLLVERTLFSTTGQPRLTLQRVPPSIYRASYPCWFLGAEQLMLLLTPEYQLTHDLEEPAPAPAGAQFRSLYWRRKNHP